MKNQQQQVHSSFLFLPRDSNFACQNNITVKLVELEEARAFVLSNTVRISSPVPAVSELKGLNFLYELLKHSVCNTVPWFLPISRTTA